ncbi:hypothetical protein VQ042_18975, partial [Aurantimonas sp. A2-1-M11]|uniref:hypothetical protein n=1 Tax=Aurantimonas sp. A2-1-M11 TaxID=3113712 RepID=UPI002F93E0C9
TPRYRDARKTWSRPARYGFDQIGLSPTGIHQLGMTYSALVVENRTSAGVTEVATGMAVILSPLRFGINVRLDSGGCSATI